VTSIARPGRYSGVHPIHAFLSNQSQATILFLVCAISVGLCLIDRETDRELAFSIFYLVPIGIAAWYGGIPQAVFVSVFSVSLWFIVDASVQHPYAHPLVPYWNATVRLSLFVVVGYLLTTLRRMFEQLREGESRYRQFASASSEGVFVHDEGIIVDASEHFASMLGYDISELIGRNGFELAAPVYRDLVRKHSRMGSEVSYSVVLCRKDGSAMPVEVTARPVAHGRKALRLVTIRDLSEWKRAEAIIRKSEARYRTVFEQSMKPIVVTTFDGSILDGNPAALRLFGTSTLDGFTQKRMVDYLTTQPDVW
jgi:PAS domain S-box-containing protein